MSLEAHRAISAGTAGDAALRGGSIAAVGMAANPLGANPVGRASIVYANTLLGSAGLGRDEPTGVTETRAEARIYPSDMV